jgi:hypothetical protein
MADYQGHYGTRLYRAWLKSRADVHSGGLQPMSSRFVAVKRLKAARLRGRVLAVFNAYAF